MSQTVITQAFEELKAQEAANGGVVLLDEFVFASVPNLDITSPIDRTEGLPPEAQIVHRQAVSKTGMINSNAVVYSVVMGADVGDFEFNWVGLVSKASGVVAMIVHAPSQKKIRTQSGQQGNVLTRSFLMEYNGASQQTQIITPADTWQIDFTARLNGVDERVRIENIDTYGAAAFLGDGFKVSKSGTKYAVKQGVGYIAGLRAELQFDQDMTVSARPSRIWVDVCWQGTMTSVWAAETTLTVADTLADYTDENGTRHFVSALAQINADGSVVDMRPGSITHEFSGVAPVPGTIPYFDEDARAGLTAISDFVRHMLNKGDPDDVLSYLGLQDVKSSLLNNVYSNHSRSVAVKLPLLFPDHDAVKAALPGASYLYPQGFAVTGGKIYISYTVEPKQARNVIVQYDDGGEYEGYYYADNGGAGVVSEGLVVTSDYGGLHLFMAGANGMLKQFSLAGAVSGAVLPLVSEHDVGLYHQFSYRKNRWVIEQDAPEVGQLITRTVFGVFDIQFNRIGTFTLPLHDSGYITEETSSYARRFTKRQGVAIGDDYIACSYGGYFNSGASAGFNQFQGVKVFSPDGVKQQESILHPQKMIDVLSEHGYSPTRVENEGVCLSDDGDCMYALYIYLERNLPSAYSEGIVLMKEFSTAGDVIDFRRAAWLYQGFDVDHASIGTFPRSAQGMINPVLGTVFTTLSDILKYMQSVSQKWFCLHTTTTPVKDLSGADIPTDTYVFIKNANNQTFYISHESGEGGIKYKAATSPTTGEFVFVRQREATWSSSLTLAQKTDGEDQVNRITAASKVGAAKNEDKILVLDQQSIEGSSVLVVGGGSTVHRSTQVIDFATNPDANAVGGTKRWRIDSAGNLRPYADNTYSIGYANFRPKEVFAATSSISTSDRTHKQDETALSAAEKRIAKKLRSGICRFRFRDAVALKGDAARWHIGLIAQDVQKAFEEEGLNAFEYGILCRDEYPAEYEAVYGTRMVVGSDGLLAMEDYDTGERTLIREAGVILSVRNDELHYLMLAASDE